MRKEDARRNGWHALFHLTVGRRYREWYHERGVAITPGVQFTWGKQWYGVERRFCLCWLIFQIDVYHISPDAVTPSPSPNI